MIYLNFSAKFICFQPVQFVNEFFLEDFASNIKNLCFILGKLVLEALF